MLKRYSKSAKSKTLRAFRFLKLSLKLPLGVCHGDTSEYKLSTYFFSSPCNPIALICFDLTFLECHYKRMHSFTRLVRFYS